IVDIGAFESRGFTVAVVSGDNQQLAIGANSPVTLTALVTANGPGEPVVDGRVTFTAPATGASATLTGSPTTITANGDASVTAAPNNPLGTYPVTASMTGATSGPAVFHLTNTITADSLHQALSSQPSIAVQANTSADADAVINAVNGLRQLAPFPTPVTV